MGKKNLCFTNIHKVQCVTCIKYFDMRVLYKVIVIYQGTWLMLVMSTTESIGKLYKNSHTYIQVHGQCNWVHTRISEATEAE